MEVNAVPPTTREYVFPRIPIVIAPVADTISVLPGSMRATI
jgi:hypothetical protein